MKATILNILLSCIILLMASTIISHKTYAQAWLDKNGNPVADTPWQKSNGTLGVMQLLSTKPKEFLENWDKPTEGVHIKTTNRVSREKPIVSFLLFTGCKADKNGNCKLAMAYKVVSPSGKLYASTEMVETWVDKPAPPKGILQLSVGRLGTIIEPKDELGEYIVMCMVWDLNAGTELLTTQKFIAQE